MLKAVKSAVWWAIHKHRRNKFVGRFALFCRNIHRASWHPGFDVRRNGEQSVLSRSISQAAPVLFDIGANVGAWTAMARSVCPSAQVHAFELNPTTAKVLAQRFAGQKDVHVHPFGLADATGEVDFFAYSGPESVLSGLRVPLHSHVTYRKEKAPVRRGDEVCRELGITRIDFLKSDAEGADFEVLRGFGDMLESQRVSVIQFEHEFGRYLRDFYDLLGPKGYTIGKLYANYVAFRDPSVDVEFDLGPNYIAVPTSNKKLLDTLKAGWRIRTFTGFPY